jgi:hypothetical protein
MIAPEAGLSVSRQCALLAVARSSFYYLPRPERAAELELLERLDRIFTDHPVYGSRRLQVALLREGVPVGRRRVRRLMRKLGRWAVRPKRNTSKRHPEHQVYPYLLRGRTIHWGLLQTVYGLVRYLNGSAVLAWLAQAVTTVGLATIVWLVWRSEVRFPLKAATLSAAALMASPWASAADMAAMVIPAAFLVADQIRCGALRGEQTIMLGLVAVSFAVILAGGRMPIGPFVIIALLSLILRRDRSWWKARCVFLPACGSVARPLLNPRYDFLPRAPLGIVWSAIGENLSSPC